MNQPLPLPVIEEPASTPPTGHPETPPAPPHAAVPSCVNEKSREEQLAHDPATEASANDDRAHNAIFEYRRKPTSDGPHNANGDPGCNATDDRQYNENSDRGRNANRVCNANDHEDCRRNADGGGITVTRSVKRPGEQLEAVLRQAASRGTTVLEVGLAGYPIADEVPGRPALLFLEGSRPQVLDAPRVAIVGTRAASVHGLADAWELGAFLGAAGVSVVSGMAIGIDGAAHHGALQAAERVENESNAGPIGVVATGLDIEYPRRHRALYQRVRQYGVLLGEQPFGTPPERGRFPVRNRIIAALADVVVVVEATISGGSRITADKALDYGRPVLAMPGSRRNPAAAGCNALLADGAQPLLDPSDVLVALGLTPGGRRLWDRPPAAAKGSPQTAGAKAVLKALGGEAAHPDQLASRTGLDPGQIALAVEELVALGLASRDRGFVWPV